jgi:hypothetical protein
VAVNYRHRFEEGILGMCFPKIGKNMDFFILQNDKKKFRSTPLKTKKKPCVSANMVVKIRVGR